jgi:hypothetical protein
MAAATTNAIKRYSKAEAEVGSHCQAVQTLQTNEQQRRHEQSQSVITGCRDAGCQQAVGAGTSALRHC